MLAILFDAEKPVGELAAPYKMSLAGAAKHVAVLERAGLIERRKPGRQQLRGIRVHRLQDAGGRLDQWRQFRIGRLDAPETASKEEQQ